MRALAGNGLRPKTQMQFLFQTKTIKSKKSPSKVRSTDNFLSPIFSPYL